ncbi:MAG TPA: AAA family ATPase [Candidatus Cybelea sp.]|nr:AAA family ATPase [Candidatus Cybelea sp.]
MYGGTVERLRSPLVGRESELDELQRAFERALRGGGGIALLWGEAGVGKTRLVEEFGATALAAGARMAVASCFESLCPPFAPIREVFAGLALPDPFSFESFASAAQPSQSARYRAFSEAADALRNPEMPLLVVLDDLQWADFATLEFLGFLIPRLAKMRTIVLATVRSDHLERDHARFDLLEDLKRRGASIVRVEPLDTNAIRTIVVQRWPQERAVNERAVARICALAEGKPYFAEELVDASLAEPYEKGSAFAPLSIRAGVLARFDRLAPEAQKILLYASVIGRNFDAALLEALSGSTNDAVCGALADARAMQLVRDARDRIGGFTFRHAITREILHHELLAVQARAIHGDVAERLAGNPDADPFDLAYHWRAAGEDARASAAYERAGDAALYRGAHHDAEIAYRGAVESRSADDRSYASLCEKFSRALSANAQIEEACEYAERAVNAYEAVAERERAASLAIKLARRTYEIGKPALAEEIALRALTLSGERGPVAFGAYVTLAHFDSLQGRNQTATAYLALADALPGERATLDRRNGNMVRAIVAATSGRLTEAFEHYEGAVAMAREQSDREQLAWTLNNYGSRAMATGWMDRARAAHEEAALCLAGDEFAKVRASTVQGLAFSELLTGNLDAAFAWQREDAQLPPGIAMTRSARIALDVRLAYYRDENERAIALLSSEALDDAFESGEAQRIGLLAGCAAACYDAAGRRGDADALRSRALTTLRSVDFSFWLLDQLAGAELAAERDRARALLARAADDRGNRAACAFLTLFDARVARRRNAPETKTLADDAAARFQAIGWPWERAQALEVAGRHAEALDLYRSRGFLRNTRALTQRRRRARHRAGRLALTPRELEVACLAAAGKSNRAIATELFIGERTVETHIAAMFDRFDLTSRRELAALLETSPRQVAGEPPA